MDDKRPWTDTWRNAVAANMANADPLHKPHRGWLCPVAIAALLASLIALVAYVTS